MSINALCREASRYLQPDKINGIHRAYQFAANAHAGQVRASGGDYIDHPLAVAQTLVEMRMDYASIAAAILHDVIEDTPLDKSHIEEQFGGEIAELVDSVTKLDKVKFQDATQRQAESFRRMVMAMVGDVRVILIKLADRLHNMHTLTALKRAKQRRIALETLEVYAPIADRLGLRKMCLALENMGFEALYPYRHRVFAAAIKRAMDEQTLAADKICDAFEQQLQHNDITAKVERCTPHPYRLYRQINPARRVRDSLNLIEFHIRVTSIGDCYRALGAVHQLYRPVFSCFKDYIALPKDNGYQSLHTRLSGTNGASIAVAIRTENMNIVGEHGIAVRWLNNDALGEDTRIQATEWLRGLYDLHNAADDPIEFVEDIKADLFPRDIYVFTPDGDIKALPATATAVDFAYAIHTDIGNHCIGAKINRQEAPLHTALQNGQMIEIITSPQSRASAIWLNFVVSAKARAGIRGYLRKLSQKEAIEVGEQLLKQALAHRATALDHIPADRFDILSRQLALTNREALLQEIGFGKRPAAFVAERLMTNLSHELPQHDAPPPEPVLIRGADGHVVKLGKCCYPIPGDPISGVLTPKSGIMVHTASCRELAKAMRSSMPCVEVDWEPNLSATFQVDLRVYVGNSTGTLAAVAKTIANLGVNIDEAKVYSEDGINSGLDFVLEVSGCEQLNKVMNRILRSKLVSRIQRIHS